MIIISTDKCQYFFNELSFWFQCMEMHLLTCELIHRAVPSGIWMSLSLLKLALNYNILSVDNLIKCFTDIDYWVEKNLKWIKLNSPRWPPKTAAGHNFIPFIMHRESQWAGQKPGYHLKITHQILQDHHSITWKYMKSKKNYLTNWLWEAGSCIHFEEIRLLWRSFHWIIKTSTQKF